MKTINFYELNQELLSRAEYHLSLWLPGGKLIGHEWTCGSLAGESGSSLKININSGKWADFATGDKGGDLISLYAAIKNLSQIDAARELSGEDKPEPSVLPKEPAKAPKYQLISPPLEAMATRPDPKNFSHLWLYQDADSRPLFYIARQDVPDGKKTFIPFSWDALSNSWVKKSWPKPRPLYGLELLKSRPNSAICLVEGEKACDAARKILGKNYICLTWPNGVNSWDKSDFSPIYGRKILLWPDADEPGITAMQALGEKLLPHSQEVKLIEVPTDKDGWDAADALKEGMTWDTFKAFAKPLIKTLEATPLPAPTSEMAAPVTPITPQILEPTPEPPTAKIEVILSEAYQSPNLSQSELWMSLGLAMTASKNPSPINNADNVARIFENSSEFKGKIWYDEFHKKIFTTWNGPERVWADKDHFQIFMSVQRKYGLIRCTDSMLRTAISFIAYSDIRNEPKNWMNSLKWDGTPRVESFLQIYMGCDKEPSEYLRAISQNFWLSMVARVFDPGVKADNAIVFEGSQGAGKSTALNIIADKWFVETNEDLRNKDFYLILHGALLVEIAELDSFSRADLNTIKKTMSCRVDRFRSPYAVNFADHPRQCIFAGTTNQDDYLKDPSGARRFWPTMTGKIDLDLIKKDRDQLFAEAVWRYKQGFPHWQVPKELAESVQESRYSVDPWEDIIKEKVHGKRSIMLMDVATDCIGMETSHVNKQVANRIGAVLRRLGYKNNVVKINGKCERRWINEQIEGDDLDSALSWKQSLFPSSK